MVIEPVDQRTVIRPECFHLADCYRSNAFPVLLKLLELMKAVFRIIGIYQGTKFFQGLQSFAKVLGFLLLLAFVKLISFVAN